MAVAVIAAIALAFLTHSLNGVSASAALFLGGVTGIYVARSFLKQEIHSAFKKKKQFSVWEWAVIAIFIIASLRSFLWLIYHDGNCIKVFSANNLGDLSLHITFINYLSAVSHWWPISPILLCEPLHYSIGPDLFNSLLLLVGVPLEQGLIWMGLLGACLAGLALWRWGKAFGIAAFLFNGGLAGILFFKSIDPENAVQWKNLFLSLFVTQRGFLYALPAGLLLLSEWKSHFSEERIEVKLPFMLQVLLLGAMPLFSVHTFLFLSVMMIGLLFAVSQLRKFLFFMALTAWPFAFLVLKLISGGGKITPHFIDWHLGWMQQGNPLWFWIWNFGISIPLVILFMVYLRMQPSWEARKAEAFVWPAVLIFIGCFFIRFAPWPWDNTKLMLWSWITIVPFLWEYLIASCPWLLRYMLCFLLFGSGVLSLTYGLNNQHGYEIAKQSELQETAALVRYLPANAIIATAPDYNHPILLLGHPVVAGYEGHLWSHGLSYQKQLSDLHFIMMGEEGWEERAQELGIRAIFWSDLERTAFPGSRLPFAYQQKKPMIYEIQ